ncbi:MAG: nucleotidyltransferase family protein [Aigarchaeota archaeon]|nr:nucleotidyltransferase family protein [Aigarchaeota archaeon]MDH5704114.1 nucleotidyltransferase family protein [Aigarchaeota archaeon]
MSDSEATRLRIMISLVVLAAGQSTRFPGNKLLFQYRGEPIIRRLVRIALASKADEIVVVTGHQSRLIRQALTDLSMSPKLKFVLNPHYTKGMSSSVRAGVSNVNPEAQAAVFLPADVALDNPRPIDALVDSFYEGRPRIAVVNHEGRRGHPILFRRDLFSEVAAITEQDRGLKALVKKYSGEVRDVPVSERSVLTDIDTPGDLDRDFAASQ